MAVLTCKNRGNKDVEQCGSEIQCVEPCGKMLSVLNFFSKLHPAQDNPSMKGRGKAEVSFPVANYYNHQSARDWYTDARKFLCRGLHSFEEFYEILHRSEMCDLHPPSSICFNGGTYLSMKTEMRQD